MHVVALPASVNTSGGSNNSASRERGGILHGSGVGGDLTLNNGSSSSALATDGTSPSAAGSGDGGGVAAAAAASGSGASLPPEDLSRLYPRDAAGH